MTLVMYRMNGFALLNAVISRIYQPLQYGKALGLLYLICGGLASIGAPFMIRETLEDQNLFFWIHLSIISGGILFSAMLALIFWRHLDDQGKIEILN